MITHKLSLYRYTNGCIIKKNERDVFMANGLFGDLFDFDGDGKLDGFEEAMEFGFFNMILEDEKKKAEEKKKKENLPWYKRK